MSELGGEISGDVAGDIFSVFCGVVALLFEGVEILFGDIAGDVDSVEYRGVEMGKIGRGFGDGVLEVLEDEFIGADVFREFLHGFAGGDQLGTGGHIDAVDVGETDGRRGGTDVYILRPVFAGHRNDLADRSSAHDGVIDQQNIFVLERLRDGVQFAADRLLALGLPRHDESTADVAVSDQRVAVGDVEASGDFLRGGAAG